MSISAATPLSRNPTLRLAMFVLVLAFIAINTWILYTFLTSKYPGATDFFQRWRGAKGFWVEGRDPYSPEMTHQVELEEFGGPPDPALDQYPGDFVYPFTFAVLIAPLTVLDYATASAIWLALIGTSVAISFILMLDLFNWRPAPWLLMIGVLWAITFYPAARGLFLGQPGTFVVCFELITIWALAKNHDTLAGILLGLTTYKPQLGILLIPFLLLWAARFGRWRFIMVFAAVSIALLAASFILLPSWFGDWIEQVNRYSGYTPNGSPVYGLANVYLPFLGKTGELLITIALAAFTLWTWVPVLWRRDMSGFYWTIALTFTVTHIILARTAKPHFVVFLFVLVL